MVTERDLEGHHKRRGSGEGAVGGRWWPRALGTVYTGTYCCRMEEASERWPKMVAKGENSSEKSDVIFYFGRK